ncbi:AI-2E family transporter [Ottowia sp. GY511]|uniref:AI-2E family transporter n=1 Tax=Ottowia flava TaxID=2675430 RepID=A0ABW4KXM2_9BURK|nr:AI-2E family transporter [Ottowia sp. GY511]TXK31411.1 AI-2E family transporter [Ottowia sp. GY511]
MNTPRLQRTIFLLLLAGVTLAFLWILTPFFGAVFWAMALALLFNPLFQWIRHRMGGRATLAALVTLLIVLIIVILPLTLIASTLVVDVTTYLQRARAGEIDFRAYLQHIVDAIPHWARAWLDRFGFGNLESIWEKISAGLLQGGQLLATRILEIGQNTFQFLVNVVVTLYLLFFLLRDGVPLARMLRESAPLEPSHTRYLLQKFTTVVRATVKGNVLVAIVQGFLGGIALWALGIGGAVFWGVVMAFLSLLPAVGAALVWAPVAIYLAATGQLWQAAALTAWGVLVIGLSDNVLRPVLVGKDTKLPDYVVLVTTLGGMSLFGINGFVIGPTIAAMFMACWALFTRDGDDDTEAAVSAADEDDEPVRTARFARARLREAPARTAEPHWLDTEEEREIERLAPDELDAWQGPDTVPVPPPPPASQPAPTDRF